MTPLFLPVLSNWMAKFSTSFLPSVVFAFTRSTLSIEVRSDFIVYNAVSPNNDGFNDIFYIQYINLLPEKQTNKVTIYNRWGNKVFEVKDYNNDDRVFKGLSNNGNELPSGTYFYKIVFAGRDSKSGYLELKR